MKKRLIFFLTLLLIFSSISYRRSQLVHLGYRSNLIRADQHLLGKEEKNLLLEINSLAPPEELYRFWKEHCPHLDYPAARPNPQAVGVAGLQP